MVEPQLISDPFGSNVSGHSYTEIGKQITEKYPGAQFNKIIKDNHGNGVQLDTIISRNGKNVYVIYKGNDVYNTIRCLRIILYLAYCINMDSNSFF